LIDDFSASQGHLADRLLAASRAGEQAGGELGGSYSGFLVVIRPDQMQPWALTLIFESIMLLMSSPL